MILLAPIGLARIAPDGSVTARLLTGSGRTEVTLSGTVRAGRFGGAATIAVGACSGRRTVSATRQ